MFASSPATAAQLVEFRYLPLRYLLYRTCELHNEMLDMSGLSVLATKKSRDLEGGRGTSRRKNATTMSQEEAAERETRFPCSAINELPYRV